jgi:hypothetical protein
MRDEPRAVAFPSWACRANDPNDLSVELEIHFGMGQEARPFADVGWDRDLARDVIRMSVSFILLNAQDI